MMTSRVTCFYPECQNDKATNCSKCFFKIPKELIRCRLWLKAMGKSELIGKADKLHRNTRICADHFNESDFTSTLRTRLLPSAVPRDFIKRNPSVLQSEITTERSKEKRNLETADASTSESSSFPEITTERSKEKRNLEMADASTPQYSSFPVVQQDSTNVKVRRVIECCVPGCDVSAETSPQRSFHKIPSNDIRRGEIWLKRIGSSLLHSKIKDLYWFRICSDHFSEEQYASTASNRKLRKFAVPDILPACITGLARYLNEFGETAGPKWNEQCSQHYSSPSTKTSVLKKLDSSASSNRIVH